MQLAVGAGQEPADTAPEPSYWEPTQLYRNSCRQASPYQAGFSTASRPLDHTGWCPVYHRPLHLKILYFSPKSCICFRYLKGCFALNESHQEKSGVCLNGSPPSHRSSHPRQYLNRRLLPTESNCSGLASCLGLLLDLAGLWPASPDISQPLDVSVLQTFSTSNNAQSTIDLS